MKHQQVNSNNIIYLS